MIDFLLSGENIPFSVAIILMLAIALLEGVTTLIGMGFSNFLDSMFPDLNMDSDVDSSFDFDTGSSVFSKFLSWIQFGKVPVLVLMIIGLTAFGISGFFIQSTIKYFAGFYLPWFIAVFPAFVLSMPVVRICAKILYRIMPSDETSAVSQDSFIGQIATITFGKSEKGRPAEAKLKDKFGQTHYLMVEPDKENVTFLSSEKVLLVERNGSIYKGIKNPNALLSDN